MMSEHRIKLAMQIYSVALFCDGLWENMTFQELTEIILRLVSEEELKEAQKRLKGEK